MCKIREDYPSDSTVTVFLIEKRSNDNLGYDEQVYIKKLSHITCLSYRQIDKIVKQRILRTT